MVKASRESFRYKRVRPFLLSPCHPRLTKINLRGNQCEKERVGQRLPLQGKQQVWEASQQRPRDITAETTLWGKGERCPDTGLVPHHSLHPHNTHPPPTLHHPTPSAVLTEIVMPCSGVSCKQTSILRSQSEDIQIQTKNRARKNDKAVLSAKHYILTRNLT